MKNHLFVLALLVLAVLPSIAGASSYCINSTTRYWEKTIYSNGSLILNLTDLESCPSGCVSGECKPTADNNIVSFAILFSMFSGAFIYLGLNLHDEHRILGWMFIPMALMMMVVGLFVMVEYGSFSPSVNSMLATAGYAIIIVLIFFISYFIINIIATTLGKAMPYSKKLKGG